MKNIKILDCTLRDGGYVNNFEFGSSVIKSMIQKLAKASIDIVECGFLACGEYNVNKSIFERIESIAEMVSPKNKKLMYVAMIQCGKIDVNTLKEYDGSSIDGIRLTFHEHEMDAAFVDANILMKKGYKVFIQPVGTTTYSDESILKLISRVNELKPYAFYVVDTLGTMFRKDLLRLFFLVDHNLSEDIAFGFHSHNNLQMSFSNAQKLMELNTARPIIIDSSIGGMGRGAGNLCTELITQYINDNVELRYNNLEILDILDCYIRPLKKRYEWGYNSAYYLASIYSCHPNYASYLLNRQTLRTQDINAILSSMNEEKRSLYDEDFIEGMYKKYMDNHIDDAAAIETIKKFVGDKKILILAPGKSIKTKIKEIKEIVNTNEYKVVSINFVPDFIENIDYVFISNLKRFGTVSKVFETLSKGTKVLITSNITTEEAENTYLLDYMSYLNEDKTIMDNAGLMCINFLRKIDVEEIVLAGFDGFSEEVQDNYYSSMLFNDFEKEQVGTYNKVFSQKIKQLRMQMKIVFLTSTLYEG